MDVDEVPARPSVTPANKRFEIKKWNAVALWAWDIVVDNCAICRNHIMDLCIVVEEQETQRLVEEPRQTYEATQHAYTKYIPFFALTSNETMLQPEGDVTDMMSSILKVVETQVVDAGVTDVNFLEQQDYDARAEYYATQLSQKTDLPDSMLITLAASGNPSAILADKILRQSEINEIQNLASRIAKLIGAMYPQVTESFVVHLDPV
ncbi:unnamed protein product [Hydatigera taeniaeformis]|uniref:Zf-ANAPC11 domain-containing protein n=1 Tax=Hydatigena taeniaeformis TaxID=6205 RepID=A0A0R3X728_HYDTA|nr:unnamed protein product [Hydatigera taeniaeformis]